MEWVCEWHSDEATKRVAATIDAAAPEKVRVQFCPKCNSRTWHALIEVKENDHGIQES